MGAFAKTEGGRRIEQHMTCVVLAECVVRDGERLDRQLGSLLGEWARWSAAMPPDELTEAWARWTARGDTLAQRGEDLRRQTQRYRTRLRAVLARAYRAGLIGPVPNEDEAAALADEWMRERVAV